MSVNGVYGYSYNPYAYNSNAYTTNATSFQGYNTTTNEKEDDGVSLGVIAAIGTGLAAIGTTIYAIKRGKSINSLGSEADDAVRGLKNILDGNISKGFKEIGEDLVTGFKSIFTKAGRKEYKYTKEYTNAAETYKAAVQNKELSKEVTEELTTNSARNKVIEQIKNGDVTLTSMRDDAGNLLTGKALENAKKMRKEEYAKALEAAKKTVTDEDIAKQAGNEFDQSTARLRLLEKAKSLLNDIKNDKTVNIDKIKKLSQETPVLDKALEGDKVNTEALKNILERIA